QSRQVIPTFRLAYGAYACNLSDRERSVCIRGLRARRSRRSSSLVAPLINQRARAANIPISCGGFVGEERLVKQLRFPRDRAPTKLLFRSQPARFAEARA